MAYTLAQLRALVLQRADMQNSTFIGNASVTDELSNYIRDSAAALHDRLINLSQGSFLLQQQSIDTVAGDTSYTLDAEFYRPIRIELIDGDSAIPIDMWTPAEGVRDMANRSWTGEVRPEYLINLMEAGGSANEIIFTPAPDGEYSIFIWYHIGPPALTQDADKTTGFFDDWIVVDAAIKCRLKEESDVTALQAERAQIEMRIDRWATQFDNYKPNAIVDARRTEELW